MNVTGMVACDGQALIVTTSAARAIVLTAAATQKITKIRIYTPADLSSYIYCGGIQDAIIAGIEVS
jgi:hypothetical protein